MHSKKTPKLTAEFVSNALGVRSQSEVTPPVKTFTGVTTDSRNVPEGSLFVAIPGEKFDGHQFIPNALEQGAAGVLCRRDSATAALENGRAIFFPVDDSIEGYRRLASVWRNQFSIPVIAVAGSVGKTTTKELLASILSGRWRQVLKTVGSQNGFVGIPMTLMELKAETEVAVVEVGIDEKGAMERHMKVVRPDFALLTAIGAEHLEKLENLDTVFREEALALELTMKEGGTAFINLDDPYIREFQPPEGRGRAIGFTLSGADSLPPALRNVDMIRARLERSASGVSSMVVATGREAVFPLVLPGEHNARNQLAAIAVALTLGLSEEQIRAGLAAFKPASGRTELHDLEKRDVRFICDHYNSNPTSVRAALHLLVEQAARREGRRWACLGDMLELGPEEEAYHRALASEVVESGIENVLLYGPRSRWLYDELSKRRYEGRASHLDTHEQLAEILWRKLQPGDTVLLKGSRGMRMEEVWKNLTSRAK